VIATLALASFVVVGDGIPAALADTPGDALRGRAIVVDRTRGQCLLCHRGPFDATPLERQQGTLASDLGGAGTRWSAAQLRLRIADPKRLDRGTIMPAYFRADGYTRVAAVWQGRTALTAQEVEDVVAFLQTLK
jgi:sulfur-oxidizing protein SoxX